jgi:hypothetical protein
LTALLHTSIRHGRAFDPGGSRRHRLGSDTEPRISLAKCGLPVTIQDPRPELQPQMGPARRPSLLWLLAEARADHLIDGRFHNAGMSPSSYHRILDGRGHLSYHKPSLVRPHASRPPCTCVERGTVALGSPWRSSASPAALILTWMPSAISGCRGCTSRVILFQSHSPRVSASSPPNHPGSTRHAPASPCTTV